jgi:hypothetical protein
MCFNPPPFKHNRPLSQSIPENFQELNLKTYREDEHAYHAVICFVVTDLNSNSDSTAWTSQ